MTNSFESLDNDDKSIAIVGLTARAPGAKNLTKFWSNLVEGRDSISHFTDDQLREAGVSEEIISDPLCIKARGVLENIDLFDPDFFGISPLEAAIMDPQHRLFLMLCWEALEIAGYSPLKSNEVIGVYAGGSDSSYLQNNLNKNSDFINSSIPYQTHIANSNHFLATKIAYHLDLKGPSVNISTGCSTALVAVIQACDSLLLGHCDLALAGGITIKTPQINGILFQEGGILSKDGKCRPFDKFSAGTVSSNGAGLVVLKRLADAWKDGDNIEAVIRGYAINNDGHSKSSYTAPGLIEQARCVATALQGIDVETITYVEAHGTGTSLGDPIEIAALTKAFNHYTQKKQYCAVGSVKSNIGHTDSAAGVLGLIKTVLALKHRVIPASLHFQEPNPHINFDSSPFYVNSVSTDWKAQGPLRAGVSSFGIGGTNAHLVLEEAPKNRSYNEKSIRPFQVVSLSAKREKDLLTQKTDLINFLESEKNRHHSLENIAYTLQIGRCEFAFRNAIVCGNKKTLINLLSKKEDRVYSHHSAVKNKIIFLFPGQGTIFPGMVDDLYNTEYLFKKYIDKGLSNLPAPLKKSVFEYFTDMQIKKQTSDHRVQQLALFILEYSLAMTLMKWGIYPEIMLGHSLGEYVAACIAGVITLQEAINILIVRGELINSLEEGAMLSVPLSFREIIEKIDNTVSVAAINSPTSCVISGSVKEIEKFESFFNQIVAPLKCTRLKVNRAFHSKMLDKVLDKFASCFDKIEFKDPAIPYLSNVSGNFIYQKDLEKNYFVNHLRKPVMFLDSLSKISENGNCIFLEIGIGHALSILVKQHPTLATCETISLFPNQQDSLSYSQSKMFTQALARAWSQGITMDWMAYSSNEKRQRVALPTYPFAQTTHWIAPSLQSQPINKRGELYEPYWEVVTYAKKSIKKTDRWLILEDDLQIARSLMKTLNIVDTAITWVRMGRNFQQLSANEYILNPSKKSHYEQLVNFLNIKDLGHNHILHCWSLSNNDEESLTDITNSIQKTGFMSIIYLAQTVIKKRCYQKTIKLTVVSNGLKKVKISDRIIPEKATILGAALVLRQEYGVLSRFIDIDIVEDKASTELFTIADSLLFEDGFRMDNFVTAQRNDLIYSQKFKMKSKKGKGDDLLHSRGVYVIMGGLGKLGLELARKLALEYNAHLILVARNSLEMKRRNPSIMDSVLEKIETIRQNAASFEILEADICDMRQMEDLTLTLKERHHSLDGIFHLAGIVNETTKVPIEELSFEETIRQFRAKIQGTKLLAHLTGSIKTDMVILFSSLSTIVGGLGFASYAAANSYLDAFAEKNVLSRGTKWLSINWDAWKSQSQSKNMIARESLTLNEAWGLLKKCLTSKNYYRIVAAKQLNFHLEDEKLVKLPVEKDHLSATSSKISKIGISSEENLKWLFCNSLGINTVDLDTSFFELGGNSLSAISLLTAINNSFSSNIKLTDFVKNSSIHKIMNLIMDQTKPSNSFIIRLKETGSNLPLFLIHPVGGTIFCYLELAKLMSDNRPLYGIQDPCLYTDIKFKTLEEIAAYYLQHLRAIQPKGPYCLGGYSYGGSLSFEMAHQLEILGEKVEHLIMIDCWGTFSDELRDFNRFQEIIGQTLEDIASIMPSHYQDKGKLLHLTWLRMKLLFKYKPPKIKTPIYLFKARDILSEYQEVNEPKNHWQKYVSEPIKVYLITGNHKTMMLQPGIEEIAKVLNGLCE